jgi:hypothetical protein
MMRTRHSFKLLGSTDWYKSVQTGVLVEYN